jgi:hypothetical protein
MGGEGMEMCILILGVCGGLLLLTFQLAPQFVGFNPV